jgi:hypothetical protein
LHLLYSTWIIYVGDVRAVVNRLKLTRDADLISFVIETLYALIA